MSLSGVGNIIKKITFSRLIECLALNEHLEEINLGVIGTKALEYLGDYLSKLRNLKYLTIEEGIKIPKKKFVQKNFC